MHDYIKIRRPIKYQKNIIITWTISTICNYNCIYCDDVLHDGKFRFPDSYEPILNFLRQVQKKYKDKTIHLCITGGECTLWKLLPEFLRICNNLNISVHIDSNGTKSVKWWEDNVEYLKDFSIAYHPLSANKKHIYNVLSAVTKKNIYDNATLFLLMIPDYFDDNYLFGKKIVEELDYMCIIFKPVRLNIAYPEFYSYTKKQKLIMSKYLFSKKKKNPFAWNSNELEMVYEDRTIKKTKRNDVIIYDKNSWKGWYCNAGIESFHIHCDGGIYNCTSRVGDKIGSLNNFKLPDKPIICDRNFCYCSQDISNTKWRKL